VPWPFILPSKRLFKNIGKFITNQPLSLEKQKCNVQHDEKKEYAQDNKEWFCRHGNNLFCRLIIVFNPKCVNLFELLQ
jgi:hypothetical protein